MTPTLLLKYIAAGGIGAGVVVFAIGSASAFAYLVWRWAMDEADR